MGSVVEEQRMDTIGWSINKKFPNLNVTEPDTWMEFLNEVRDRFSGLVLYHGSPLEKYPGEAKPLWSVVFLPAVQSGRCALLVVDTVVFSRPSDCQSPYMHFYSVSVPNLNPNPFEPLFQRLIDQFRLLSSLPTEPEIKTMWAQVDPHADKLAVLRLFEEVLYAQKGNDEESIRPDLRGRLGPPFDAGIETYGALKAEYIKLCDEGRLKKN
jgi:hypothetical protein